MSVTQLRYIGFSLVLFGVLLACQPSSEDSISSVDRLYREYELQPTAEKSEVYLDTLSKFVSENIEDLELIKPHLIRGVEVSKAQGQLSRTPSFILPLLRLYPNLENKKAHLVTLGDVLYALRKRHASSLVYSELIKKFPGDPLLKGKSILIDSIAHVEEDYLTYLFDQILVDPDQYGVNKAASLKYVDAVEAKALVSPEDTEIASHIYRAGEVARSLRTFPKAMSLYDWLIEEYPDHEKAPTALFIKGFILEQDYDRTEEARLIYTDFLSRYPNHEMAESAQFLLNNLGKSDEEILQAIEARK